MRISVVSVPLLVALLIIGVAWIYAAGALRRAGVRRPVSSRRHLCFAAGLVLLLASLEPPFEGWSREFYSLHQLGILVARTLAPALIAAARPAGLLIAGLPRGLRDKALKPVLLATACREAWRTLATPGLVIVLYVAALYLSELPALQAAAVADPLAGYADDGALLVAGLLFWTRIFQRRPAPHGPSHGWRLAMLALAMMSQILLGAYVTFKGTVLFPAYVGPSLDGQSPLFDQQQGGLLIWMPTGLLMLLAVLMTVHGWGTHESLLDQKRLRWTPSNSAILLYPTTGEALREMARGKNRRLAIALAAFVLGVFGLIIGASAGGHRASRRENLQAYRDSRS
jgi:putative membrane protein